MNQLITLVMALAININTTLKITSPAFSANDFIPEKYSCKGANTNPEINIANIPKGTKYLALIIDDPDAPKGNFDHWIMWNIPVKEKIAENSAPGVQGLNGKKENSYTGPCPPSGTHHYHFKVYALDAELELPENSDKEVLLDAMKEHIIGSGELIGLFKK